MTGKIVYLFTVTPNCPPDEIETQLKAVSTVLCTTGQAKECSLNRFLGVGTIDVEEIDRRRAVTQ